MLNGADITGKRRKLLWAECASTATDLENMVAKDKNLVSNYQKFFNRDPPFMRHLRTFGEVGVSRDHQNSKI